MWARQIKTGGTGEERGREPAHADAAAELLPAMPSIRTREAAVAGAGDAAATGESFLGRIRRRSLSPIKGGPGMLGNVQGRAGQKYLAT